MLSLPNVVASLAVTAIAYVLYLIFIEPRLNPLKRLPGPPSHGLFGHHMTLVME